MCVNRVMNSVTTHLLLFLLLLLLLRIAIAAIKASLSCPHFPFIFGSSQSFFQHNMKLADYDSNFGAMALEIKQRAQILDKFHKNYTLMWLKKLSYSASSNAEVRGEEMEEPRLSPTKSMGLCLQGQTSNLRYCASG